MKLPNIDPVKLQRRLGLEGSLHDFVRMAFHVIVPGEPFVDNWHIEEVCAHLEAAYRGECRQLAICIPPGCMKSLIVSVLFPVWCWIRDPALRFAVISYDPDLSGTRDGAAVISLIQSPWFKERWGDRVLGPTDQAMSYVKTTGGGFRFATSIKGKYTGRHVHFEIVDDPINPKDLSKVELERVKTWRQRVAPTRLIPPKKDKPGARIYIMQRLHEDDAVGLAEKEEKLHPGTWTFLRFPMEYSANDNCRTKWGGDRRTSDGELLWPERFSAEEIASRKRSMGARNVAAQFQQRPTPEGGLVFSAEGFRYFEVAPAKFDQMIMSVDAAFKNAATSDNVAIGIIGRVGGEFFLLDMMWRRMSFTATLEAIRMMARKWPRARAKLIEDKANGSAIIDTLKKEISGIIPVEPEGGKEARAQAVEPYFAAGNVYFPNVEKGAIVDPSKSNERVVYEWVDPLKLEMLGFPFAANDDGVDMLSQGLLYFRQKQSRFGEAMAAAKQKGIIRVA